MSDLHPKVLGIDFGSKRIGVAMSDALFIAAHPLEMVPVDGDDLKAAASRIGELARENEVELAVVGLPLSMDDTDSAQTTRTRAFAVLLETTTGLRVELEDERLTSVSAEEIVNQTATTWRKQRKARKAGKVDVIAAQMLLHSWMERQRTEAARLAREAAEAAEAAEDDEYDSDTDDDDAGSDHHD